MKDNKRTFKSIIIIILTSIMILGIIAVAIKSSDIYATEYKDSSGVIYTYTASSKNLKITGKGKATNIWKNKTELGDSLETTITSVTIGKEITEIDVSAFEGCTALTKVTFSTGVTCTSIGNNAFKGCSALTNIVNVTTSNTLPKTITTIGDEAFSGCSKLAKLNLNTGLTTIGTNAFKDTTSLTTLTIHNIQNSNNAFKGHTGITTLTIGNTCTTIQDNMFEGCTELTTVTFASGSTCTTIGNSAFKGCGKLSNIKNNTTANTLPASITTIGNEAFSGCTSLKTLTFASGSACTSIGNNTFDGCTSLTTFTIPDKVTTIESNTFKGCTSLNTLTIGTGVTSIGKNAFNDAPLETKLQYNAINCTDCGDSFTGKQIGTVAIGSKVEVIPNNFIKGNKKIKKITIPATVTKIKTDAFNDCLLTTGIIIKNRNCEIETTSTISKDATVFVPIPAGTAYRSFNGVDSNGTTFSTLLKWLYENDKSYVPYASKARDTHNMNTVSQSTIDTRGSLTKWASTLGDYGYKVGTEGGPTGTPRRWLFSQSYSTKRNFGCTGVSSCTLCVLTENGM